MLKRIIFCLQLLIPILLFSQKVPFRLEEHNIIVDVIIGNKTGIMVFDTGATHVILNPYINWTAEDIQQTGEVQAWFGLNPSELESVKVCNTSSFLFGSLRFNFARPDDLQLILPAQNSVYARRSFQNKKAERENLIAVFGIHVLHDIPFSINYETKIIEFYPNGFNDIEMDRLALLSHRPIISITKNSAHRFLIDSGYPSSMIHSSVFFPDSEVLETWSVSRPYRYFSDTSTYQKVLVDNFKLGLTSIDSWIFRKIDHISQNTEYSGLLGFDFLAHFAWYFNLSEKYVGIVPIKTHEKNSRLITIVNPGLGINSIYRLPGCLLFTEVDSASILLQLGLLPEAVITKVNGLNVDEYTDNELQYLLSGNTEINIECLQDNNTIRVNYEL